MRLIKPKFWETKNFISLILYPVSAITYLIDRSLFRTLNYPIKVETEGISRGKTWMGMGISRNEGGPSERLKPWEGRKNVNVCVDVDAEKVISLILDRLSY